jgi:hypothetical protein
MAIITIFSAAFASARTNDGDSRSPVGTVPRLLRLVLTQTQPHLSWCNGRWGFCFILNRRASLERAVRAGSPAIQLAALENPKAFKSTRNQSINQE